MTRRRFATLTNHRNGTVTISGLTPADLRLVSYAVDEGAFAAGDRGGDISKALVRLGGLLRIPSSFPEQHAPIRFIVGTTDAALLYEEETNLS